MIDQALLSPNVITRRPALCAEALEADAPGATMHQTAHSLSPALEVLPAGTLSSVERIRGRALAVAQGTILDADLMAWFLEERAGSEATRASYACHLRRLDWFARRHLGLPSLRNLQREDWDRLKGYLIAPPTSDLMNRSVGVEHPDWRPFRTRLTEASAAQALGVIQGFMGWLAEPAIGVLHHSPFASLKVPRPRVSATGREIERYLPNEALRHLFAGIDRMRTSEPAVESLSSPPPSHPAETSASAPRADTSPLQLGRDEILLARQRARLRFLIALALMSGLRASELARARSSMIKPAPTGGWVLHIRRKGSMISKLPLSGDLMRRWDAYARLLGRSPNEDLPLIGRLDDKPGCPAHSKELTRQTIWDLFNQACDLGRREAQARGDEHSAAILERASTHWARHTFGVQLMDSGSDLRSARELLEHASLNTTTIYTHISADQRRKDLERMTLGLEGLGRVGQDS